jgi:hypothetical protein
VSYYHDDPPQEVTSSRSFLPGLLVLIVLITGGGFFVKSTLAANINLSSGGSIEFGQSVSQAVACSGSQNVTVTPKSSFVNTANGSGTYYLASITVGNIPTSCYGTNFKLSAYGPSSSTPLALFNSTSTEAVVYNNSGSFEVRDPSDGITVSGGSGTYTVTFDSPVALSTSVFKVTIQSGVGIKVFQVGQTGPGGGIIFYKSSTPFTCGPSLNLTCTYLESAPTSGPNAWSEQFANWSGNTTVSIGTTGTGIGTGYSNTLAIIAQDASVDRAGTRIRAYRGPNNLSDWFLPSKDELAQLYLRKTTVGGFVSDLYTSSSEFSATHAWNQYFTDGTQVSDRKHYANYIRPIRAF